MLLLKAKFSYRTEPRGQNWHKNGTIDNLVANNGLRADGGESNEQTGSRWAGGREHTEGGHRIGRVYAFFTGYILLVKAGEA